MVASTLQEINVIVLVADLASIPCMLLITTPSAKAAEEQWSIKQAFHLKAARTPAAAWMFLWIFFLALGFHAFNTILMPSLGPRFEATAVMHMQLQLAMGLGGFFGTILSQEVVRRYCTPHPTRVISVIVLFLSATRLVAFKAPHFWMVPAAYFVLFTCIGVLNVIKPMMWMQLVDHDELGGIFGLQESLEGGLTVVLGPILAGLVGSRFGTDTALLGLLAMWVLLGPYAYFGYPRYVLPTAERVAVERKAKAE